MVVLSIALQTIYTDVHIHLNLYMYQCYDGHIYNVPSYNLYFDCDLQQVLLIVDTHFSREVYFVSCQGIDLISKGTDLISEKIDLISEEIDLISEEVYLASEEIYLPSEDEEVDSLPCSLLKCHYMWFHTTCKTCCNLHCSHC